MHLLNCQFKSMFPLLAWPPIGLSFCTKWLTKHIAKKYILFFSKMKRLFSRRIYSPNQSIMHLLIFFIYTWDAQHRTSNPCCVWRQLKNFQVNFLCNFRKRNVKWLTPTETRPFVLDFSLVCRSPMIISRHKIDQTVALYLISRKNFRIILH